MTSLSKKNDMHVTNVLKYRPYKVSAKGTVSNRPPKPHEIELMAPFLLREIETIAPKVVVTLGNVPLKAVYKKDALIGGCHASPLKAAALSLRFTLSPFTIWRASSTTRCLNRYTTKTRGNLKPIYLRYKPCPFDFAASNKMIPRGCQNTWECSLYL